MMTPTQRTLVMILVFVALIVGSFIWFIASWDPSREEQVSYRSMTDEVRRT